MIDIGSNGKKSASGQEQNCFQVIYYVTLNNLFKLYESQLLHKGSNLLPELIVWFINICKINPSACTFHESLEIALYCGSGKEKQVG